jgi:GNAT superfamily N-acetyltransferase
VGLSGAGPPPGETFPHDPAIPEEVARAAWLEQSKTVMVAEHARRQGVGSRLCQHSLQTARRLGFRLIQFNLVVSTNTAGIRCWQRNCIPVVGILPGAFSPAMSSRSSWAASRSS